MQRELRTIRNLLGAIVPEEDPMPIWPPSAPSRWCVGRLACHDAAGLWGMPVSSIVPSGGSK